MNFNDVLNTPVEDIKRPPLPPFGTYKFAVSKTPTIREQKSGKTGQEWDIIDFVLKAVAPGEDVDISELQNYGDVKNIIQQKTFMFDRGDKASMENTLFNLKRFITEHLNVEWPDGTPLKAALAKTVNATCMGNVQYEPDKNDPEVMWARLKSTTSAQ
jgi:hypothetical protein